MKRILRGNDHTLITKLFLVRILTNRFELVRIEGLILPPSFSSRLLGRAPYSTSQTHACFLLPSLSCLSLIPQLTLDFVFCWEQMNQFPFFLLLFGKWHGFLEKSSKEKSHLHKYPRALWTLIISFFLYLV